MNWYKAAAKHQNDQSMICGHCGGALRVADITANPNHIYYIGQLYKCGCNKSEVWTNSIRNEQAFVKAVESNQPEEYYQGFCNDLKCGFCNGNIYPLQNGVSIPGFSMRLDRWGCKKCNQNQNILLGNGEGWGENVTPFLFPWYAGHLDQIKSLS